MIHIIIYVSSYMRPHIIKFKCQVITMSGEKVPSAALSSQLTYTYYKLYLYSITIAEFLYKV